MRANIILDRDSVCMADDVYSHEKIIEIEENITLRDFIIYFLKLPVEKTYTATGYIDKMVEVFPKIAGGCATWILSIRKEYKVIKSLAVVAQQWKEPKLLVDNLQIGELITKYQSNEFHMKYLCQVDPEETFIRMIGTNIK